MTHALTRYRLATGTTVSALARQAGTSRQSIHRIERREQTPSLNLIGRIVAACGGMVRADDFLISAVPIPSTDGADSGRDSNAVSPATLSDPARSRGPVQAAEPHTKPGLAAVPPNDPLPCPRTP